VGNRRRVLEDGDDKLNSSDEDDEKMKPDEPTDVYTAEMDPKAGPRKLSQAEAARQRAMAQANRAAGFPDPVKSYRLSTDACTLSSEALVPQGVDKPVTRSRAVTDSTPPLNSLMAAASQRASADQPKGAKAPPPTKEQQAPKHPMATRTRKASGAGGLRGVVGSGSTGYVCDKLSPSSKPGS
jgi:hypothetical protein